MSKSTIEISEELMQAIVNVLEGLPSRDTRHILNAVEQTVLERNNAERAKAEELAKAKIIEEHEVDKGKQDGTNKST